MQQMQVSICFHGQFDYLVCMMRVKVDNFLLFFILYRIQHVFVHLIVSILINNML